MTIEEALVYTLSGSAPLNGLIGDGKGALRLYPLQAPQDLPTPFVLYATSDPDQLQTMTGWLGLWEQAFRFDCYGGQAGGSYASAKAVAGALFEVLGALPPQADIGPRGEVRVQLVERDGGSDELEPPVHADESGVDYVGLGLRVHWSPGALAGPTPPVGPPPGALVDEAGDYLLEE